VEPGPAFIDTIDYSFTSSPVVQAADWIGCLVLGFTSLALGSKIYGFKPAGKHVLYFFGYEREMAMLPVFICTFAFTAYWSRVCMHLSGVGGRALYEYRYADYVTTCPLLTFTLMATLNLPYKFTSAVFMAIVIVAGFMSMNTPGAGRYVWFGLGMVFFAFTWYRVVTLCQVRFMQYFGKKHRILRKHGKNKRLSFASAKGLRDKKIRGPLQTFLASYFGVWCGYPLLWILEDFKVLDNVVVYVIHVVLDVLAKVVFGYCIVRFQFLLDKMDLQLEELRVTLADMIDDYQEALKKDKAKRREKQRNIDKYGVEDPNVVSNEESRDDFYDEQMAQDPYALYNQYPDQGGQVYGSMPPQSMPMSQQLPDQGNMSRGG